MDDVDVLYEGRPHDDVLVVICRIHGMPSSGSTLVRYRWRPSDERWRPKDDPTHPGGVFREGWIFVEVWTQNGWQRLFDHKRSDPDAVLASVKDDELAEVVWVTKRLLSQVRVCDISDPVKRMYEEAFTEEGY